MVFKNTFLREHYQAFSTINGQGIAAYRLLVKHYSSICLAIGPHHLCKKLLNGSFIGVVDGDEWEKVIDSNTIIVFAKEETDNHIKEINNYFEKTKPKKDDYLLIIPTEKEKTRIIYAK